MTHSLQLHLVFLVILLTYGSARHHKKHHRHSLKVPTAEPTTTRLPEEEDGSHHREEFREAVPVWKKHDKHVRKMEMDESHEQKHSHSHESLALTDDEEKEFKEELERMAEQYDQGVDPCQYISCKRREVCFVDTKTQKPECLHKRVMRLRRKLRKMGLLSEDFKEKEPYRHRKHNHGHHPKRIGHKMSGKHIQEVDPYQKKLERFHEKQNNVLIQKGTRECTHHELHEIGRRLLDWFKLLQDDEEARQGHSMVKRNSKKRVLKGDGSCECAAPVVWEFQQLDHDSDGSLSASELGEIEDNVYEPCVTPFLDGCDRNADMVLSEQEWCCCYADILPPCLNTQKKLLAQDTKYLSTPGLFIPSCDVDGFYQRMQCHSRSGQCWCVDRNGHEIPQTRVLGTANCSKYDGRYRGNQYRRK